MKMNIEALEKQEEELVAEIALLMKNRDAVIENIKTDYALRICEAREKLREVRKPLYAHRQREYKRMKMFREKRMKMMEELK